MSRRPWSNGTRHLNVVRLIGFICILTSPLWVYGLFFPFPPDYPIENNLEALLLILVLVLAIQIILIRRMAAGDHFMAEVMMVGFLLKLAAVSAYLFMSLRVYGFGDLFFYFFEGSRIVNRFSLTGDFTLVRPFSGTNSIVMLTSWLIFAVGPAFQALMIIFATLSFWGQYLFYRAFCIAFPMQQHKAAALFMFFLPSIVFWTATIGKDAVIFFFIGGCCYGFAKMAQRSRPGGLVTALVSLGGIMLVRPHVAMMLGASLATAYLFSRNRSGALGVATKICSIPLLLFANAYFFSQARAFLDERNTEQTQSVLERAGSTLEHTGDVNYHLPGSAFGGSLTYRLLAAPFLLFRPFPWEVRNAQSAIGAIETLGVMIFVWRRRKVVRSSLRLCGENAVVLFLWLCFLEFSLLLALAMTNFGTLAREKDMLIPFALMIVLSQPLPTIEYLRIRGRKGFALAVHRSLRSQGASSF